MEIATSNFTPSWLPWTPLSLPGKVKRYIKTTKMKFLFTHAYKNGLINYKIHSPNPKLIAILITDLSYTLNFVSSPIGRLIPAQPNFLTLHKSEQCSPRHELFSDFLVSYESWDHNLSIHIKLFPRIVCFTIPQLFQKCMFFFETPGIGACYMICSYSYHVTSFHDPVEREVFVVFAESCWFVWDDKDRFPWGVVISWEAWPLQLLHPSFSTFRSIH